jgi:hypothetical protein
MDQNRKFSEMNGICWHERADGWLASPCKVCGNVGDKHPDFSFAHEVLKVVMKREDWQEFRSFVGSDRVHKRVKSTRVDVLDQDVTIFGVDVIHIDLITTPGKLRDAWSEWRENKQTKEGL